MTRAELLTYIATIMADLLTSAGVGSDDDAAGLKYPIDSAYRRMGYAESDLDTAEPDDVNALQDLAEYYTVVRVRNVFAARVDFDATAIESGKRSALFEQVDELVDGLIERCAAAGYPVAGGAASDGAYAVTSLYVDYLEPQRTS